MMRLLLGPKLRSPHATQAADTNTRTPTPSRTCMRAAASAWDAAGAADMPADAGHHSALRPAQASAWLRRLSPCRGLSPHPHKGPRSAGAHTRTDLKMYMRVFSITANSSGLSSAHFMSHVSCSKATQCVRGWATPHRARCAGQAAGATGAGSGWRAGALSFATAEGCAEARMHAQCGLGLRFLHTLGADQLVQRCGCPQRMPECGVLWWAPFLEREAGAWGGGHL